MNYFWIFALAQLSTQLTHFLIHRYQWNAIRVSAGGTILFVLLLAAFPTPLRDTLYSVYLGGSFVGMSDAARLKASHLFFASMIFGLIFVFVLPFNIGMGGALGAAAFVSVSTVYGMRKLLGV